MNTLDKRKHLHMINSTPPPNRNQEENKKTSFDRNAKPYKAFLNQGIIPIEWFDVAPRAYFERLTRAQQKVFPYVIAFVMSHERTKFSHWYVASRCELSISTVQRCFKKFKDDGLMASHYRHMNTCYYKIAPAFYTEKIRKVLACVVPFFATFFALSLIASQASPIKNDRQIQEKKYIRTLFRNERTMSCSRIPKSSKNVQIPGEIAGETWKPIPKLRSIAKEDANWLRACSPTIRDFKTWQKKQNGSIALAANLDTVFGNNWESSCKIMQNVPAKPKREDFVSSIPFLKAVSTQEKTRKRALKRRVGQQDEVRYRKALKQWRYRYGQN